MTEGVISSDLFEAEYSYRSITASKSKSMPFPTIFQNYVFISRYARFLHDQNRREQWPETVKRYFDFMKVHLKEVCDFTLTDEVKSYLEDSVLNCKVMPSMRCLMTAGPALARENCSGFNCEYLAIDNPKCFSELLYLLMNGCFHEDVLVKTINGNKKISELTNDDEVLTYDIENQIYEYIKPVLVMSVPQSINEKKIELEFEDGSVIKCTEKHEFLTKNRGWIMAKDLTNDDDILNYER